MINRLNIPAALALALLLQGCSGPPRLKGPAPNILLIVMDAARADHLSCYGYGRPTTPNIDRVAAAGLRFTRVVSASSWTTAAHASLFTGLLPSEHGTHSRHAWLIDRIPTLAELLKQRGYHTAGFSNNPHMDSQQNLDKGFEQFKAVWSDTTCTDSIRPYNTARTNELVRSWLESPGGQGAPFFVFINYMDTHMPYGPPEPYLSRYLDGEEKLTPRIDSLCRYNDLLNSSRLIPDEQEKQTVWAIYDGGLTYLDFKIGELLGWLHERKLDDNTLVIITSDHGEVYGEHKFFTHGGLLIRPLVQIPLIFYHPRLTPAPAVREKPVAISDIFHTIVDLLGIEGAAATGGPVRNLLDPGYAAAPCYSQLLAGRVDISGVYRGDLRALWTTEDKHFIYCEGEDWECYDLAADFDELHNLCPSAVSRDETAARISGFESTLLPLAETAQDRRITRQFTVDPQRAGALRALGYVGGGSGAGSDEHPHMLEHLTAGIFYYLRDDMGRAQEELRFALEMNPVNPEARMYLGFALYRAEKTDEAIRLLRSIIGKTQKDFLVRLVLGQCLEKSNQIQEALEQYRAAADLDPADESASFSAAGLLLRSGDTAGAEKCLDRLLSHYPGNFQLRQTAINMYSNARAWEAARRLLLEVLKYGPDPGAMQTMAQVCLNLGRKDEAKSYYRKLLALDLAPDQRRQVEQQLRQF